MAVESSNEEFLEKLSQLFAKSSKSGSVFLNQKRLSYDPVDQPSHKDLSDLKEPVTPFAVLFRASDGKSDKSKRVKISTVVQHSDLDAFWTKYTEAVKTGMSGLRKKDKKKQKKQKKLKEGKE